MKRRKAFWEVSVQSTQLMMCKEQLDQAQNKTIKISNSATTLMMETDLQDASNKL
jgi:hypothetical protein